VSEKPTTLYHVSVASDADRVVHADWIGRAASPTEALRAALDDRRARVPDEPEDVLFP